MKQLTTSGRVFGPFHSVETLTDRYLCDGIEYQFDTIGAATVDDYQAPPLSPQATAALVDAYMAAVQRYMDACAVGFGYDDLIAVISYAEEPSVARYQAEGLAFRAWRSQCWYYCEQVFADVQAEERTIPTEAELIAELPAAPVQAP